MVVGALLVLSVACGDDGPDESTASTTARERATTTTTVPSTTSTTPATAAPPTTAAPGSTSTAPASPTTTVVAPPVTAAPSDPMPDGRSFGFVTGVDTTTRSITIDVAELLTGDDAVVAAVADGAVPPDATSVDNDYYIRNRNPLLRIAPVAPNAVVRTLKSMGSPDMHETSLGQLGTNVSTYNSFGQPGVPVWATVSGGVVTRVDEVFFP